MITRVVLNARTGQARTITLSAGDADALAVRWANELEKLRARQDAARERRQRDRLMSEILEIVALGRPVAANKRHQLQALLRKHPRAAA